MIELSLKDALKGCVEGSGFCPISDFIPDLHETTEETAKPSMIISGNRTKI
jgi:hypothetical protein